MKQLAPEENDPGHWWSRVSREIETATSMCNSLAYFLWLQIPWSSVPALVALEATMTLMMQEKACTHLVHCVNCPWPLHRRSTSLLNKVYLSDLVASCEIEFNKWMKSPRPQAPPAIRCIHSIPPVSTQMKFSAPGSRRRLHRSQAWGQVRGQWEAVLELA